MRIYLIGFMGSGKSALGRQLAILLHTAFVDLDEMFEKRYRISIYDFFATYGEDHFRKAERELLLETAVMENTLISTGGGTPCFYDNMKFITSHGISVYLRMTTEELAGRLKNLRRKRPLLRNIEAVGLEPWIKEELQTREGFYLQATHIFYPLAESLEDLVLKLK